MGNTVRIRVPSRTDASGDDDFVDGLLASASEVEVSADLDESSARDNGPILQPQPSVAKLLKQENNRPAVLLLPPLQARADFMQRPRLTDRNYYSNPQPKY